MSAARKPSAQSAPSLYRPFEIARALDCSEWWVKEQARKRRIPFTWIGGSYRFTQEQLSEIIQLFEVRPKDARTPKAEPTGARSSGTSQHRPTPTSSPSVRLKARPPRRGRRTESDSPAA